MRKLLFLLLSPAFLLAQSVGFPGPGLGITYSAGSGITLIASNGNTPTCTTSATATTAAMDMTGSNLLVAVTLGLNNGSASVTDSLGNTWNKLTLYANPSNAVGVQIHYAKNASVSASQTFTLTRGSAAYPCMFVAGYSNANTTSPFDLENGHGQNSGLSVCNSGAITPSVNNSLVVVGYADNDTSNSKTLASPFTRVGITTNTSFATGAWGYNVQTTAASANPNWTNSGTVAAACSIASFKP